MSQVQSPLNTSDPSELDDKSWVDLLQNLTTFITASASLVNSLRHTIEVSKQQGNSEIQDELACGCAKELLEPKTSSPKQQTSEEPAKVDPNVDTTTSATSASSATATCCCRTKSKGSVKKTKSKSKADKLSESYAKEKTEKLNKLKEEVKQAQKNLSSIQEQVRQLERLYQDYESLNTPTGQVNPAALYRQIMKPQTVPHIDAGRSSPTRKMYRRSGNQDLCTCDGTEVKYTNQNYGRKPQVAVLRTVPFNQTYY